VQYVSFLSLVRIGRQKVKFLFNEFAGWLGEVLTHIMGAHTLPVRLDQGRNEVNMWMPGIGMFIYQVRLVLKSEAFHPTRILPYQSFARSFGEGKQKQSPERSS
jgi:hypothetical protein